MTDRTAARADGDPDAPQLVQCDGCPAGVLVDPDRNDGLCDRHWNEYLHHCHHTDGYW